MALKRIRIIASKMWTVTVCFFSVAVLSLFGSCRSKKVTKTPDVTETEQTVNARSVNAQTVRDMEVRVESLKKELDNRSRALIYGPPEIMERRAEQNRQMRTEIDSLEREIRKYRQ